jgi:hypothetical protein
MKSLPTRLVSPLEEREFRQQSARAAAGVAGIAPPQDEPSGRTVAGFLIESDKPVPRRTPEQISLIAEAMAALKVGDSFLVPGLKTKSSIASARKVHQADGKAKDFKFVSQVNSAGLRIWRIK